jgi:hypothetical protein
MSFFQGIAADAGLKIIPGEKGVADLDDLRINLRGAIGVGSGGAAGKAAASGQEKKTNRHPPVKRPSRRTRS